MRRHMLITALTIALVGGLALPILASSGSITLDFMVIRDTPGSTHVLYQGPMPVDVIGEDCEVTASSAGNNTSVHEGNNLLLGSGGDLMEFSDVERAPNVSTQGVALTTDGTFTPEENGFVELILGPDGVYSADLILEFDCTPLPPPEDLVEITEECDRVTVTNNSDRVVTLGHFDVQDSGTDIEPGETFSMPGNPGVRWFVVFADGQWPENLIAEGEYEECPEQTTTTISSTTTIPSTTTEPTEPTTTTVDEPTTTTPPAGECVENPETPEFECLPFTGSPDIPWLVGLGVILFALGLTGMVVSYHLPDPRKG